MLSNEIKNMFLPSKEIFLTLKDYINKNANVETYVSRIKIDTKDIVIVFSEPHNVLQSKSTTYDNTIWMLNFHSKKVMCIHQEIYAHLIMYNFAEMITSHVVIENKQRKYTYKANFSVAAHMCRLFYQGKTTSPNLETIISRNIIPVRPDRHRERKLTVKVFHGFLYRVA